MTDGSIVRVYFDTNVFIELLDRRTDITRELWRFFGPEAGKTHQIITSELTLSELLVKVIEQALVTNDYAKRDLFLDAIVTKGNEQLVEPVDRDVLHRAALIRAQLPRLTGRKIKLPDAIHLATAMRMRCAFFITGDLSLQGAVSDIAGGRGLAKDVPTPTLREAVDLNADQIKALATRLSIQ